MYRESPGKFDSRTLSRKTLSRWTGCNGSVLVFVCTRLPGLARASGRRPSPTSRVFRKGTNWVSTHGVTANLVFLTEGPFGYSRSPTSIFPEVPGRTLFPNLSKCITLAAAPLVSTPFVRNQGQQKRDNSSSSSSSSSNNNDNTNDDNNEHNDNNDNNDNTTNNDNIDTTTTTTNTTTTNTNNDNDDNTHNDDNNVDNHNDNNMCNDRNYNSTTP